MPRTSSSNSRKVRFVLSESAVRGLRESDRVLHDLFRRGMDQNWPGQLTSHIAEAYVHVQHAMVGIEKCNVETDPAQEEEA